MPMKPEYIDSVGETGVDPSLRKQSLTDWDAMRPILWKIEDISKDGRQKAELVKSLVLLLKERPEWVTKCEAELESWICASLETLRVLREAQRLYNEVPPTIK